jgi:hypothetical protein
VLLGSMDGGNPAYHAYCFSMMAMQLVGLQADGAARPLAVGHAGLELTSPGSDRNESPIRRL